MRASRGRHGLVVGAVALCAALWLDPVLLSWTLAQLASALAPVRIQTMVRLEHWAWRQWEWRLPRTGCSARPLLELKANSSPDLRFPFILRGVLNGTAAIESFGGAHWLQKPPVGELQVDYFTNASEPGLVVPDARGRLADVVEAISAGGPQKIGTEMVFRAFPDLLTELELPPVFRRLFGEFRPGMVGRTLTVPIFMASGPTEIGLEARTEMHAEPISNCLLMLQGTKRWTLLSPDQSWLLRPALAPDGRAYFLSMLEPTSDSSWLEHVEHWQGETTTGDVLWIPAWTWHRVTYSPNVTSLSASLFHFKPLEFARLNSVFALLSIPNIVKEIIGWKTQ